MTVQQEDEYRDTVLKNALSELRAFQRKYSNFSEFSKVFDAIKEIENAS